MGRGVMEYLWKVPLCALTYLVGTVFAGAAMVALGLPLPELPSEAGTTVPLTGLVLGSVLLVLSLGLGGSAPWRARGTRADAGGVRLRLSGTERGD